jgi:sugar transferase (PEP-CTERM/EpsH1 system associated)
VKFLLLTPQPPYPAHQGTAIRNWAILRHLAATQKVTLLTFSDGANSDVAPVIRSICRSVYVVAHPIRSKMGRLLTLAAGEADLARRLWSAGFDRTLRQILAEQEFDVVQVEGLELGRYLHTVRHVAPGARIVYDAHNAEISIQRRAFASDRQDPGRWLAAVYSRRQLQPLARFEAAVCRAADAVTVVSGTDGSTLSELAPGLKPFVVPNGIDLDDYRPTPLPAANAEVIVFTGKMDYRPNLDAALWFADKIMPLVQEHRPQAVFQIVGQGAPPQLARAGERPGIVVTGAVPDTRPYISGAAVYVAPLRMGGGTRFKLLEAMALSRPVLSTRIGAEGFEVESERELLLADTPDEFATAVLRLLDDVELAARLGTSGREFVRRSYSWDAILPRLDAVYADLRPASQTTAPSAAAG